jgi:probable rRNA maturation factor
LLTISEIMTSKSSRIKFFFDGVSINLRNRQALKRFIHAIFRKESKKLDSINYIFCSDRTLLKINQKYLKRSYLTDIISFDLSTGKAIVAEVYISVDRVRENADEHQTSFQEELHRVVFHGVLHLCGYKDKGPAEKRAMRSKENYYLQKYLR